MGGVAPEAERGPPLSAAQLETLLAAADPRTADAPPPFASRGTIGSDGRHGHSRAVARAVAPSIAFACGDGDATRAAAAVACERRAPRARPAG